MSAEAPIAIEFDDDVLRLVDGARRYAATATFMATFHAAARRCQCCRDLALASDAAYC